MITTDMQGVTTIPDQDDGRRSLEILPMREDGVLILMIMGPRQGLKEIVRVKGNDLATAVARARNRSRFIDSAEHMLLERHLCELEKESYDDAIDARVSIIVFLQRTGKLSPYDLQVLTENLPPFFKRKVESQIQE